MGALLLDINISRDEWKHMSNEEKGKTLAAKSIQSDFEKVLKFDSALKANQKKGTKSGK